MVAKPVGMPPNPSPTHHTSGTHAKDTTRAGLAVGRNNRPAPIANWTKTAAAFHKGHCAAKGWTNQKMDSFTSRGSPMAD
jgi:hypothetical protein